MIRSSDTWMTDNDHASVFDLRLEVERLRAELYRVRAELAEERSRNERLARSPGQGKVTTAEFLAPLFPATERPPAFPAERASPERLAAAVVRAEAPPPRATAGGPPSAPFAARPIGPTFVLPRDQGIDFGAIKQLSAEELDALPYGLITLDAEGRILHYNDTESRMVGLPKHQVLGRRFFGEVAPCARVREFEGRFQELVRDPYRVRVQTFDFVFRFANGDQQVTIVLTPARERGQYHMALLRRQDR